MQQARAANRLIAWTPNVLSALRLVLAVSFPLLTWHWRSWAGPVILIAGLSDLADGIIARRLNASSWIGGHLDAVADKAFVLAVLVTFVWRDEVQPWQVALLLSRDVVVVGIAAWAAARRHWDAFKQMPARLPGKATTAANFAFLLLTAIWPQQPQLNFIVFSIAVTFSIAAAIDYLLLFWQRYRQHRRGEAEDGGLGVTEDEST